MAENMPNLDKIKESYYQDLREEYRKGVTPRQDNLLILFMLLLSPFIFVILFMFTILTIIASALHLVWYIVKKTSPIKIVRIPYDS